VDDEDYNNLRQEDFRDDTSFRVVETDEVVEKVEVEEDNH
jgi:hypothetical protein